MGSERKSGEGGPSWASFKTTTKIDNGAHHIQRPKLYGKVYLTEGGGMRVKSSLDRADFQEL